MIDLYNSTNGASWTNKVNWLGAEGTESTWYGVTTDAGNTAVLRIDLHGNNLAGALPTSLGILSSLQYLFLHGNRLTGSIPASLGSLNNLYYLHLDNNQLSGSIPPELGNMSKLQFLFLNSNQLSGSIPSSLGNLSSLSGLVLHSNRLTGSIPPELGNLSNLHELNLQFNQLTGSLPPELGRLSSLTWLYLNSNRLSGSIPAGLAGLIHVRYVYLNSNQLSGSVPPELSQMATLGYLYLHSNRLSGSIPPELGDMELNSLYLNDNQLTGSIPPSLGDWHMQYLRLDGNQLEGSIPSELGGLVNLKALGLRSNRLTGSIPASLGNLSKLFYLDLASNLFTGSIPASLGALSSLQYLFLCSNRLTGSVPTSMINLTSLNPAGTDLGYNALHASDAALIAFLNSKDPDWASTQTIAPTLVAAVPGSAAALVSWTPIAFTGCTGGYRVYYSTIGGGPYTFYGQTADKSAPSLLVSGLTPGIPHFFVVLTRTDANPNNPSLVDSEASLEASTTPAVGAMIAVASPDGGENWATSSTHDVLWETIGAIANVKIELSTDWGAGYATVIASTANTGSYSWTVPNTPSATCLVRVSDASAAEVNDVSDALFTIAAPMRKDDLLGTWAGQGVYYRNSDTGGWTRLSSPATKIAAGDLTGDGIGDLIGIWPAQGGVWARFSEAGAWALLASTAERIAAADMNGDGRDELLGSWTGQGVFWRDNASGAWTQMATPATQIAAGDLDGDGTADLIGVWPSREGVWAKYSQSGTWALLSSTAEWLAAGDMNGDGRDDLLGAWTGQGVCFRDSLTGQWVLMAAPATMITAGDLDADGQDDLIGIWPAQGGVWAQYSQSGDWAFLSSIADGIAAGKMRSADGLALDTGHEAGLPMGGLTVGPLRTGDSMDFSANSPGRKGFTPIIEKRLDPDEGKRNLGRVEPRIPGPGEPGFRCVHRKSLFPGQNGVRQKALER